jgi:hypothetical protein
MFSVFEMEKLPSSILKKYMEDAGDYAKKLLLPSLVPIYLRHDGLDIKTEQIGTGILISINNRCVLLTARHVFFGREFDEDPFIRHIVFNDRLRGLFELKDPTIYHDNYNDLAALFVDEIGVERCLPLSLLSTVEPTCRLIAIHGFLGRDFRREIASGALKPQPYFYINRRIKVETGYVGMLYPRRRNRSTTTGMLVHTAVPEGLSGCPMLDADRLAAGELSVVGVFTDYKKESGSAFGESSLNALQLIARMQPVI